VLAEDVVSTTMTLVDESGEVLLPESESTTWGAGKALAPTRRTATMARTLRRKYMVYSLCSSFFSSLQMNG
jgi:hypothetical protein